MRSHARFEALLLVPALVLATAGCDGEDELPPPPSPEEVAAHYEWEGELDVTMSGNVAQVAVAFDPEAYERGGDLWEKAFPYIFLFSPGTRDALEAHEGLGGVRVVSTHPNGDTVAEALLQRGELNDLDWREALSVAAEAREEGTERPGRMRDLVQWGEDHTEFEYNPDHIEP